jgi:hypothetical protein
MAAPAFEQGGAFRLRVTLKPDLNPQQSVYGEFTGPDGAILTTTRCIKITPSPAAVYSLDGQVKPDSPCGLYKATKLQSRGTLGSSRVQDMEIPKDLEFQVVPPKPQQETPPPEIVQVG